MTVFALPQMDPYLELIDDIRLQAVCAEANVQTILYGSQEDDMSALNSLSAVGSDDQHLKHIILSHLTTKCQNLSEVKPKFCLYMAKLKNLYEYDPNFTGMLRVRAETVKMRKKDYRL